MKYHPSYCYFSNTYLFNFCGDLRDTWHGSSRRVREIFFFSSNNSSHSHVKWEQKHVMLERTVYYECLDWRTSFVNSTYVKQSITTVYVYYDRKADVILKFHSDFYLIFFLSFLSIYLEVEFLFSFIFRCNLKGRLFINRELDNYYK